MSDEGLVIATTSDGGYLPAACCQLKSVWEHLGNRKHVPLFLVVCDVSREDQREAERFSERSVPVEIITADDITTTFGRSINGGRDHIIRLHFDNIFGPETRGVFRRRHARFRLA
jgi:hypothetical protein